jgi:hypothetical protein
MQMDNPTHKHEGKTTSKIERTTARLPSGAFLSLAIGSIVGSAILMAMSQRRRFFGRSNGAGLANFVGQWAPTLLVIGLYNKLVKVEHELFELHSK